MAINQTIEDAKAKAGIQQSVAAGKEDVGQSMKRVDGGAGGVEQKAGLTWLKLGAKSGSGRIAVIALIAIAVAGAVAAYFSR